MHNAQKSLVLALLALLGGLGFAVIFLLSTAASASEGHAPRLQVTQVTVMPTVTEPASPTPSPSPTPTPVASIFLPRISIFRTPPVELLSALTSDLNGGKLQAFLPGAPMIYRAGGVNYLGTPVEVGLRWGQEGPCSAGSVYSGTLTIPPVWETVHYATAPNCIGVYTATASLRYEEHQQSQVTRYAVNPPGSIQINVQQGFDKCYYPDLDDMATWWQSSPYVVYNLYLGGVSFACDDQPLDAVWVHQAAQQGWQFILTWVGPQAPCSRYKHKISSDPEEAYQEGREEASSAHSTAVSLGFYGPKVIYYDLESYSGASGECRAAVKAFLDGWSEKLHDLGDKSGAYGAPCTSYISDWATVDPPPDDVWIAHWYLDEYDPQATVWDTPCLSDSLWPGFQRIKQYAGGHKETWGGVQLTIDSNVLNGEITVLPVGVAAASAKGFPGVVLESESEALRDLGLFTHSQGWLVAGERLLVSQDGGQNWQDITPSLPAEPGREPGGGDARLLGASFYDRQHGWVALKPGSEPGLWVAYTRDGGRSWQPVILEKSSSLEHPEAEAAYFEILDEHRAYLALRLPSGSSFSVGRLFFLSADGSGGFRWEERSLPLGEAVHFEDEANGWTVGGADGKQVYRTRDGGRGWLEIDQNAYRQYETGWVDRSDLENKATVERAKVSEGILAVDATEDGYAWAIVQGGECLGEKRPGETVTCTQRWDLLASEDGGISWEVIR